MVITDSDLKRWNETLIEVDRLLVQFPGAESNIWMKRYPSGSCSVVSFAVGSVLHHRFGEEWRLVSRLRPGGPSHAWLVLKAEDGTDLASIDGALHQFPDIASEPFVGKGSSPAARYFTDLMGQSDGVSIVNVPSWWHHGSTREIYRWAFPQLAVPHDVIQ